MSTPVTVRNFIIQTSMTNFNAVPFVQAIAQYAVNPYAVMNTSPVNLNTTYQWSDGTNTYTNNAQGALITIVTTDDASTLSAANAWCSANGCTIDATWTAAGSY